jgi:hypothetical protein
MPYNPTTKDIYNQRRFIYLYTQQNSFCLMKKTILLVSGLLLFFFAANRAEAQVTAVSTAATSATVITPISIIKNADLNFGNVVPSGTAGTVIISTAGVQSFTGGALAFTNDDGSPTAASFTVSGEEDATYSISLTSPSITVTNGSNNMTVGTFVTSPTSTGVLTSGSQVITIGATLSVGAGQAAGLYQNADGLEITVAYN